MPIKMPSILRQKIIEIARAHGFEPEARDNGNDLYDKLIILNSARYPSQVKIDKVTGFTQSGELRYLKVAVHPDHYRPELENPLSGIRAAINRQTGKNRHSHSGYAGFPIMEGNDQPIGMAYHLDTLDALGNLLSGLTDVPGHQTRQNSHMPIEETPVFTSDEDEVSTPVQGNILKSLIIDEPWIDLILSGNKIWEMRSQPCRIRGKIGLIRKGSGMIVGTADLIDDKGPLSRDELVENRALHAITQERLPDEAWMEKWNYAWVLANVQRLATPQPYRHPSGAVIWVNVPNLLAVA